jgi:hypothetical protein
VLDGEGFRSSDALLPSVEHVSDYRLVSDGRQCSGRIYLD